jgi:aminoglycoside 6'-N-acetyltransferase
MLASMGDILSARVGAGTLAIRPMRDAVDEYERIAAWRNLPHVREWWEPDNPPATAESVAAEYGADVLGTTATRVGIIEVDGAPVGLIQWYPWAAYEPDLVAAGMTVPPGAWGLDIFIGDPRRVGGGIGSAAVRLLCDHLFGAEGATAVAFCVEKDNRRARRAYEKAGLTPTTEFLDTDTRGGERVTSILMVRHAG